MVILSVLWKGVLSSFYRLSFFPSVLPTWVLEEHDNICSTAVESVIPVLSSVPFFFSSFGISGLISLSLLIL